MANRAIETTAFSAVFSHAFPRTEPGLAAGFEMVSGSGKSLVTFRFLLAHRDSRGAVAQLVKHVSGNDIAANLRIETLRELLPFTLIFFFVYAQLVTDQATVRDDRRLHFDELLGYLGTASVIALLYFRFANDWLVTMWAVAVFVLFGMALLLDRSIFLHQGILLTIGTCVRALPKRIP